VEAVDFQSLPETMAGEVATELPPRTDAVLTCELEPSERAVYDAVRAAVCLGAGRHDDGVSEVIAQVGPEEWRARREEAVGELVEHGVPEDIARRHAFEPELVHGPDIIQLARDSGRPIDEVARLFLHPGGRFWTLAGGGGRWAPGRRRKPGGFSALSKGVGAGQWELQQVKGGAMVDFIVSRGTWAVSAVARGGAESQGVKIVVP